MGTAASKQPKRPMPVWEKILVFVAIGVASMFVFAACLLLIASLLISHWMDSYNKTRQAEVPKAYVQTADSDASIIMSTTSGSRLYTTHQFSVNSNDAKVHTMHKLYCFSAPSDQAKDIITDVTQGLSKVPTKDDGVIGYDFDTSLSGMANITTSLDSTSLVSAGLTADNLNTLQTQFTQNGQLTMPFILDNNTGTTRSAALKTSNPDYYPKAAIIVSLDTVAQNSQCYSYAKQASLDNSFTAALDFTLSDESSNALEF